MRAANRTTYPPARAAHIVEDLHGVPVADPYRWLEDPDSPETRTWVDAQNALTRRVLDGPLRESLAAELRGLYNYPRTSVPVRRGTRLFFSFNEGLRDQPVFYVMDDGQPPRVLLDPNTVAGDGTVALTDTFPNDDGSVVACALSKSGSDRQELLLLDIATGAALPDRLEWLKFATVTWSADGASFYYTRFPSPGSVPDGDEHYFPTVHEHRLGQPQSADRLVFGPPADREVVFNVDLTEDDRWLVVTAFKGASDRSEIYVIDRASQGPPRGLFTGFVDAYTFIGDAGGRLYFITDEGAPNGRIVAVDPRETAPAMVPVVGETTDKLTAALIADQAIVACHLHQANDRVSVFTLDGEHRGVVPLPAIGSITGVSGRRDQREAFLGFWSFTHPPASYRFEPRSAAFTLVPFEPFAAGPRARRDPNAYVTSQVWFASRDGTRVSMFLVHRKDLVKDGNRPVLLNGYGGFNVNMTPLYDPATFALLDRGGIFVQTQLRGGGEYGETWHQAGMLERKQNVFDDFIAAAEWLIREGYTQPRRLAIEGGSNGGLLTGAVTLQRPDLFGAVLCRVPVADMLRYHLFTVGRFWIPEYGCADDPAQFPFLLKYSPYHNVQATEYPPVLVTTADTDDRVAPGMAKKFAARLQADGRGGPFLIRVETKAGHGAGKPVSKMIDEDADIFTFLFTFLEVQ